MLKVYGIHGRTTAIIRIPVDKAGRAFLECEFGRGRMGAGPANRPATYATNDPVKQSIIENSPMFSSGGIKLVRTYEEEAPAQISGPAKSTAKSASPKKDEGQPVGDVPGVTSREEAIAYLKAHGAKAVNLRDDEAIKNYMTKIGANFPNIEL